MSTLSQPGTEAYVPVLELSLAYLRARDLALSTGTLMGFLRPFLEKISSRTLFAKLGSDFRLDSYSQGTVLL
jgi:hypothetical protein